MNYNELYMNMAFEEAKKAFSVGEIPIGAIIVKNNQIIAKKHNLKEKNGNVIDHAEILCIQEASKVLQNWRLDGCDIYITLEPCPMCASAIKQSRIDNVYCALDNNDDKSHIIIDQILSFNDNTNKKVSIYSNLATKESQYLLNQFFLNRRKK